VQVGDGARVALLDLLAHAVGRDAAAEHRHDLADEPGGVDLAGHDELLGVGVQGLVGAEMAGQEVGAQPVGEGGRLGVVLVLQQVQAELLAHVDGQAVQPGVVAPDLGEETGRDLPTLGQRVRAVLEGGLGRALAGQRGVVGAPTHGVGQHVVRDVDALDPLDRVRRRVAVGVVERGQRPVRGLDDDGFGVAREAEGLVVIGGGR